MTVPGPPPRHTATAHLPKPLIGIGAKLFGGDDLRSGAVSPGGRAPRSSRQSAVPHRDQVSAGSRDHTRTQGAAHIVVLATIQ